MNAPPPSQNSALVLSGGGARTAYQAGVLAALGQALPGEAFPFRSLFGTSAGAINAVFLASRAHRGASALETLPRYWQRLRCDSVYRLNTPAWAHWHRWLLAWKLSRQVQASGALLDNTPLAEFLRHGINWPRLNNVTRSGLLDAVGVTASSYTSGEHWTFCQVARPHRHKPLQRPGRRLGFGPLTLEHVMASSAIPFVFPAQRLSVSGPGDTGGLRPEAFGDGAMRHLFPLSAPLHLGASRLLVISAHPGPQPGQSAAGQPSLAHIAGHALNSVFHDALHSNMDQTQRLNRLLSQLPDEQRQRLPYRVVDVMAIHPSRAPDDIAREHLQGLPQPLRAALSALGLLNDSSGVLASYLLFDPGYIGALLKLGWQDGLARQQEMVDFLRAEPPKTAAAK